jgi:hypothetical protein
MPEVRKAANFAIRLRVEGYQLEAGNFEGAVQQAVEFVLLQSLKQTLRPEFCNNQRTPISRTTVNAVVECVDAP